MFDFVVIGAGAAGEAAGHLAAQRGASVAVVDRELVRRLVRVLGVHAVQVAPP